MLTLPQQLGILDIVYTFPEYLGLKLIAILFSIVSILQTDCHVVISPLEKQNRIL